MFRILVHSMNTLRTIFHFALNLTRHVGTLVTVFTLDRCLPYLPLLPPDHQQRGPTSTPRCPTYRCSRLAVRCSRGCWRPFSTCSFFGKNISKRFFFKKRTRKYSLNIFLEKIIQIFRIVFLIAFCLTPQPSSGYSPGQRPWESWPEAVRALARGRGNPGPRPCES